MFNLQKITSEYSETEDRLQLTGEDENGRSITLCLTQRLLLRLIPHLLDWLANQTTVSSQDASTGEQAQNFMQGFAQQAAAAELAGETPVQASATDTVCLVREVDVTKIGLDAVVLVFKTEGKEQAGLNLQAQQVRQWLAIVHSQWLRAEWSLGIWPSWMTESEANTRPHPESPIH